MSHVVGTDIILLTFLLVSVMAIILAEKYLRSNDRKFWLAITILGISSGLAMSTKLNGIMPVILFVIIQIIFLGIGVMRGIFSKKNLLFRLVSIVVVIILTSSIFTLLNPSAWENPISGIYKIFMWRQLATVEFVQNLNSDFSSSIMYRIPLIIANTLHYPYSIVWYPHSFSRFYIESILLLTGITYMISEIVMKKSVLLSVYLILYISTFIIISIYVLLPWDRYLLPLIPYTVTIQALGVKYSLKLLTELIEKLMKNILPSIARYV